jgi:hypothetical protein
MNASRAFAVFGILLALTGCSGGGGGDDNDNDPAPTATLGTSATSVASGGSVTLTWNSTNATSCAAGGNWSGTKSTSGSEVVSNITAASTFSLVCSGGGGNSNTASVNVSILAPAVPTATLQSSAPSVASGGSVTLTWTSTSATACTASGGWTGAKTASGTEVVSNITAATTYSIACTGTGGTSPTSSVNVTILGGQALVSGTITFARIPFSVATNLGLNYAASTQQPARGIQVHAINPTTQAIITSATTDASGNFQLTVNANTNIQVRAEARMVRPNTQPLPRWDVHVQDADATTPVNYAYSDSQTFSSANGVDHDLAIPSGFSTTGAVTGTRHSAPFAILDTVYQGIQTVLGVAPTTNFPELTMDWAANNPGGETFFDANDSMIVLSADPSSDTDEFDQHVIAHEFGHYIEFNFSRADNIGGSHGLGDRLDPRVAFGEGFGYAFAAIVLNDPVARDSFMSGGGPVSSTFNVESNNVTNPGWFSEASVWSILWDLHDSVSDGNDSLSLGFTPLWNVLTNAQRTTNAFTTVFAFVDALKDARPGDSAAINMLVGGQSISVVADEFGTGETNHGGAPASSDVLPLYATITPGTPVILRSSAPFGTYNTIGNHRYLRLVLATTRNNTRITVTSDGPDPDMFVYRQGDFVSQLSGEVVGNENTGPYNAPAGTYILDVYECANGCTGAQGTPGPYNLTITVN